MFSSYRSVNSAFTGRECTQSLPTMCGGQVGALPQLLRPGSHPALHTVQKNFERARLLIRRGGLWLRARVGVRNGSRLGIEAHLHRPPTDAQLVAVGGFLGALAR